MINRVLVYEHDHSSRVHIDEAKYNVTVKLYTFVICPFVRCLNSHTSAYVKCLYVCLYRYMYLCLLLLFKKIFPVPLFFSSFFEMYKRPFYKIFVKFRNSKKMYLKLL